MVRPQDKKDVENRSIQRDYYRSRKFILLLSSTWLRHFLTSIRQLMKLYDRDRAEDEDPSCIPADLVHHFLLGICSRPGFGICFKDNGWYPREQDADEKVTNDDPDLPVQKGSKIYNKILSNVLKTLKVNEDPRQQELALRIMASCPELVAG